MMMMMMMMMMMIWYTKQGGSRRQRHSSETPLQRRSCPTVARSCSMLLGLSVLRQTARRTPRRVQAQTSLVKQHCGLTADCSWLYAKSFEFDVIISHNASSCTLLDWKKTQNVRKSGNLGFEGRSAWYLCLYQLSFLNLQHVAIPLNFAITSCQHEVEWESCSKLDGCLWCFCCFNLVPREFWRDQFISIPLSWCLHRDCQLGQALTAVH